METIQVVLDKKLLQATDRAARHAKQNRSALVREALREHLLQLETQAREDRDREGYLKAARRQIARLGSGGCVAGTIARGNIRLYRFAPPDKQRPVVVLTRDRAAAYLSTVTVAPITSTIRGVPLSSIRLAEICAAARFSIGCDASS
jgi:hypothetical protein